MSKSHPNPVEIALRHRMGNRRTQADSDRMLGGLFGYPLCCIEQYIADGGAGRPRISGLVPCDKCLPLATSQGANALIHWHHRAVHPSLLEQNNDL